MYVLVPSHIVERLNWTVMYDSGRFPQLDAQLDIYAALNFRASWERCGKDVAQWNGLPLITRNFPGEIYTRALLQLSCASSKRVAFSYRRDRDQVGCRDDQDG